VEGDVHLREQMVAPTEIFAIPVAAQSDCVRMLAEEQDVWDDAGFAGFDELMLERAGWGVGQEACVHLPADFFWVVHEPLKTLRLWLHCSWRTEVRRYENQVKGAHLKWPLPFDPALRDLRMNRAAARFTKSKPWPEHFSTKCKSASYKDCIAG
jgi:hypothetical protein